MKAIYIIFICIGAITFNSCDIQKRAVKTKTDRTLNEQSEVITKRKGDTVTYEIPNIKLKDTTIYTVNRQGTTLRTVYDTKGQISQIDCFASMIDQITRSNKQLIETIKDKDSEKTENFDSSVIIYFMIGIVFIVMILAFFGYRAITKYGKTLDSIIKK